MGNVADITMQANQKATEYYHAYVDREKSLILLAGYSRLLCNLCVPLDILKLISSMIHYSIEWKLTQNEKSFKMDNYNCIKPVPGPMFIINDVKFQLFLSTNKSKRFLIFYLQINPDTTSLIKISSITVYVELFVENIQFFWKSTLKYLTSTKKWNSQSTWYKHAIIASNTYTLSSVFRCYAEILDIEYNTDEIFKNNVQINENIRYEWNLSNDSEINKIKQYANNKDKSLYSLYSSCFGIDDNFCFVLIPNDFDKVMIFLKLLKLPAGIISVSVDATLKGICYDVNNNICKHLKKQKLNVPCNYDGVCIFGEYVMLSNKVNTVNTFSFAVDIQIIQVYQYDGSCIDKNKWPEFGII
eukprot:268027_1